jgi:hypothetical protein
MNRPAYWRSILGSEIAEEIIKQAHEDARFLKVREERPKRELKVINE